MSLLNLINKGCCRRGSSALHTARMSHSQPHPQQNLCCRRGRGSRSQPMWALSPSMHPRSRTGGTPGVRRIPGEGTMGTGNPPRAAMAPRRIPPAAMRSTGLWTIGLQLVRALPLCVDASVLGVRSAECAVVSNSNPAAVLWVC